MGVHQPRRRRGDHDSLHWCPRGLITVECKVKDGYSYLTITVNADPGDPRADDIPGDGAPNWGLHTVDLSITQQSLIGLVRSQSTTFLRRQR